jgi:hypothetical protein
MPHNGGECQKTGKAICEDILELEVLSETLQHKQDPLQLIFLLLLVLVPLHLQMLGTKIYN